MDANPETAELRSVQAMPHFEVFRRGGHFVEAMRGAEQDKLEELLRRHIEHSEALVAEMHARVNPSPHLLVNSG